MKNILKGQAPGGDPCEPGIDGHTRIYHLHLQTPVLQEIQLWESMSLAHLLTQNQGWRGLAGVEGTVHFLFDVQEFKSSH